MHFYVNNRSCNKQTICWLYALISTSNLFTRVSSQACGGEIPGLQGNLTHTEYPNDYGSNANCQWSTIARDRDTVFFDFDLLNVESDQNGRCSYDYVSIQFPTEENPEKFCGHPQNRSPDEEFKKNGTGDPVIKFVSDDSVQYPGFLVNYLIERFDYCVSEPCENGGTCVLDDDTEDGWKCECVSGWTGQVCDEDLDECEADPCENGGTCTTPDFDMHSCECPGGYTGENCEIDIDECESQPCQNGATCVDDVNQYACGCASGYTGEHCETDIDECESDPCQNGGSCKDDVNEYQCECVAGYEGTHCESDIDECSSSPCKEGATCTDQINQFECTCERGYDGTLCDEEIDECSSDPCQHGSTCEDKVDQYTCNCAGGYTGDECQIEVDECDSDPCQNGAHCVDHPGSYECVCKKGYTGTDCDEEDEDDVDDNDKGDKDGDDNDGNADEKPTGNGGGKLDPDNPGIGLNNDTSPDHCASNPCLNDGTCVNEEGSFRCECATGYSGNICQEDEDKHWHDQAHLLSAILPSILFLLLGTAIALAFFFYFRKKRRHSNRVHIIDVKPVAEPKRRKKRREKKGKKNHHKKKQKPEEFRYESDSDVVSVVEHQPNRYVGIMPRAVQKPVMMAMPTMYGNYQNMVGQPSNMVGPPFNPMSRMVNEGTMPQQMYQPLQTYGYNPPQHLQTFSPQCAPLPAQNNPHYNQDPRNYAPRRPPPPMNRYNHNYYENSPVANTFDSRDESDETEDCSSIITRATTPPSDRKKKAKSHKKDYADNDYDTVKARMGSDKRNPPTDLSSIGDDEPNYTQGNPPRPIKRSEPADQRSPKMDYKRDSLTDEHPNVPPQPERKRFDPRSQPRSHWQDRDDKKLNCFPSSHRCYQNGSDLDPEVLHALKRSGTFKDNDNRPRYYRKSDEDGAESPTPGRQQHKNPKPESTAELGQTPNRKQYQRENPRNKPERQSLPIPRLQRQHTIINRKQSILSSGLRASNQKRNPNKHITFDPTIKALTPIREDPLRESNHEESLRHLAPSREKPLKKDGVRSERHPPEGGISSNDEAEDQKPARNGREQRSRPYKEMDRDLLTKEGSKVSFFKLIRRSNSNSLNINRGRGFNRENAFIQNA